MADSADGGLGSTPMQKKDCIFFVHYGACSFGENCKFNHPAKEGSEVVQEGRIENLYAYNFSREKPCKFYRAGVCRYGMYCEFNHMIPDPPLQYNSDGLPMRLGEQVCSFYLRNQECGYGAGCKFHHPEIKLSIAQEYGFLASSEAQAKEYDDGPLENSDAGYCPISTTGSSYMQPDYPYNMNQ